MPYDEFCMINKLHNAVLSAKRGESEKLMKKSRLYYERMLETLTVLYLEHFDIAKYRNKAKMKLNTLMSEYSFYYNF